MWFVWDTKKGRHLFGATKGQRWPFLFPTRVSWFSDERSSPQARSCKKKRLRRKLNKSCVYPSLSKQQTLRKCFKVELRRLTDVDSSHFPLACHTTLQIHKHTHRLAVPLRLPPYTQYTHHNDLARPTPCWSIYLLHSNLPSGFDSSSFMPLWRCEGTTPCLWVRLSVRLSPSMCLSLCQENGWRPKTRDWAMMLHHRLKWSRRYFEVPAVDDLLLFFCWHFDIHGPQRMKPSYLSNSHCSFYCHHEVAKH